MGSWGYYTWNAYSSTEQIEDLLAQGIGTMDPEVQREAYYALQKLYHDDAMGIPLIQWYENFVMRDWIQMKGGYYYRPIWPDTYLYYHFTKGYD